MIRRHACIPWTVLWILAHAVVVPLPMHAAGTWTALTNIAPGAVTLLLLLPDGTVMAQNGGGLNWFRLTPDDQGSYANGTWTSLAPMHNTRSWFASAVLRDGRVFIAGAEYGTGGTNAEIYQPLNNQWTLAPVPLALLDPTQPSPGYPGRKQALSEPIATSLPNGNILLAPKQPGTYGGTLIFNITSNTWSAGPALFRGGFQDEASWAKLPDASIVSVDPFGTNSERYVPSSNTWVNDANVPVPLYGPGGELGGATLLPDGRAFYLGGGGHTAFYTPSGSTNPGAWQAGPDIPDGLAAPDGPAAMMVNGKLLCAFGPPVYTNGNSLVFPAPTSYYEFDSLSNSFTRVTGPTGLTNNIPPYNGWMLDLPDGTVLHSFFSDQVYLYHPDGSRLLAGKPSITGISWNSDGSLRLTGRLFNGISTGAVYGDDNQMDSNYPLVRLSDSAGHVYYLRTHHWSSTGVMTGNALVTTEADLSPNLPAGTYALVVVANGNSSDAVSIKVPQPYSGKWTVTSAPPTNNWAALAASADGATILAASYDDTNFNAGPIYISTNAGWTWNVSGAPAQYWYGIACSTNASKMVAVTLGGGIYSSTNSGVNWASTAAPFEPWYAVASSYDGKNLVAVTGYGGLVYTSTNSGATWTSNNVPHNHYWYRVASSADGSRIALISNSTTNGAAGAIFTSTNGGFTWASNNIPLNYWTGIASSGDGRKLVACTDSSKLYTSGDGGAHWTAATGLFGFFAGVASSADGSKLIAVANSGRIYTSIDSGAHWTSNAAPSLEWQCVAASRDGNIAAAAVPFGQIYTLQTPPKLTIVHSVPQASLSWPWPSAGFVLQQTTNLSAPAWQTAPATPALTTDWRMLVSVTETNPASLFRLILP